MKRSGGFSFFGYLLFVALLGAVVFVIVTMVRHVAHSAERELIRTTAVMLAEGKMEMVQALPFEELGASPRSNFGGRLRRFSSETTAVYVKGPADLRTPAAQPTLYKKVTVAVFHGRRPYARLTCVRTSRK